MKWNLVLSALCGLGMMACEKKSADQAAQPAPAKAEASKVAVEMISKSGSKTCFEYQGKNMDQYKSYVDHMAVKEKSTAQAVENCSDQGVLLSCEEARMVDPRDVADTAKFGRGKVVMYAPNPLPAGSSAKEIKDFAVSMCKEMLDGKSGS